MPWIIQADRSPIEKASRNTLLRLALSCGAEEGQTPDLYIANVRITRCN